MKGLFINSKAKKCSIHESGKMIYDCLLKSKKCEFDYIEIDADNTSVAAGYDLYFFNYHYGTMSWLDIKKIKKIFGFAMTVVLEVLPNDPFPLVDENSFDIYCAIDPTMNIDNEKVFAFPRPLEPFAIPQQQQFSEIPIIGSFGLPTFGKGFERIVEAVNKEFDKAIIKINMPAADMMPNSELIANEYEYNCKATAKNGIEVQVTHDFMSKDELINWCSQNTINCFFYDRNQAGLSATTDQAISSERPLLVSDNETFRHIAHYLKPYPAVSIKEAIENSARVVRQIKQDWSQEAFAEKFDSMIEKIEPQIIAASSKRNGESFILPKIKGNVIKRLGSFITKQKQKIIKKIVNSKKFQTLHRKHTENLNDSYVKHLQERGYVVVSKSLNNKLVSVMEQSSKKYSEELFQHYPSTESLDLNAFNTHKIVHVSTYGVVCGISDYCKLLKEGLDKTAQLKANDVIAIDPKLVNRFSTKQAIKYYSDIAEKCKGYDTVILQHEFSFFMDNESSMEISNQIFIGFLTKLNNIPSIKNILVVMHSSPDLVEPFSLGSMFWKEFARIAYLKKVKVLSTNIHMAKELANYEIFSHPLIVPVDNVINKYPQISDKIKEGIKNSLSLKEGDIVLAIIGFITPFKNHQELIEVLKELPDNYKLLIVGGLTESSPKSWLSDLQTSIDENALSKRVFITGCWKNEDLASYIEMTDIMLAPYSNDFKLAGASILTMIQSLKPVVAYATESLLKTNEHCLFKPLEIVGYKNKAALRDKIISLAKDEERQLYLKEQAVGYINEVTPEKLAKLVLINIEV